MGFCPGSLHGIGKAMLLLFTTWLSLTWADMAPSFVQEPKSTVISHHASVTLRCEVAPSSASVQWLFNKKQLDPREHAGLKMQGTNLHFEHFKHGPKHHGNDGEYQCIASTSVGSIISRPAVLSKPVLKNFGQAKDTHINVTAGGLVVLPCQRPESVPEAQTVFQKNDGTLLDRSKTNYHWLPSGSLLIEGVKEDDSGEYRCVAVNPKNGHNQTADHVISVTVLSQTEGGAGTKIVDDKSVNLDSRSGVDLLLECPTASHPAPQVQWQKYGGNLPQNRSVVEFGNLWIRSLKYEDAGTYICEGTSPPVKKFIVVDVQEPPSVQVANQHLMATASEEVELRCEVRGNPEPQIVWYHNAKAVTHPSGMNSGGSIVTINKVAPTHEGIYQCLATNIAGSAHASIRLEVNSQGLGPSGGTDEHGGLGVTESDDHALDNKTTDDNIVNENRRRKPDRPRKNRLKGKGKGRGKKRRKKGRRGKKKNGKNKKDKLVPPSRPTVSQLSETSVMLNWTVPQNDGLPITFFRVQFKEVAPKKGDWHTEDVEIPKQPPWRYEVSKLKAGHTYKFRIAAVYSNNDNEVGRISQRFTLTVAPRKEPRPPQDKPTIVQANPIQVENTFAIGIKWQYLAVDSSPIEGFFIHYKPYELKDAYKRITLIGAGIRTHVLTKLMPDTEYSIKMQCFNSAGESDFSTVVVKRTLSAGKNSRIPPSPSLPRQDFVDNKEPEDKPRKPPSETQDVEGNKKTNTQSSSEMLYMILGIVLGIMLLLLIVFMFMCWWKQRQQRRMMAMNGVIHAKFQDQAQKIYTDSMRKKYMNGFPLNGLNGVVANGHIPYNYDDKINININPLSSFDAHATTRDPHAVKTYPNQSLSNGTGPMYGGPHNTSDNNFNSISTSKSLDEVHQIEGQPATVDHSGVNRGEPTSLQQMGRNAPSFQATSSLHCHGYSSNEEDMSGGENNCGKSPRIHLPIGFEHVYTSDEGFPQRSYDGGTEHHINSARHSMDNLSPPDHILGNHGGKHKRRRKRPQSREHTTKDQATNTDLSSNEGTIEFTTFNKSPSSNSEKSRTFSNNATQCTDFSQMNGGL